ncbi:MAG: hypothetical protein QM723_15145 [Myxococcaceae bacterium]
MLSLLLAATLGADDWTQRLLELHRAHPELREVFAEYIDEQEPCGLGNGPVLGFRLDDGLTCFVNGDNAGCRVKRPSATGCPLVPPPERAKKLVSAVGQAAVNPVPVAFGAFSAFGRRGVVSGRDFVLEHDGRFARGELEQSETLAKYSVDLSAVYGAPALGLVAERCGEGNGNNASGECSYRLLVVRSQEGDDRFEVIGRMPLGGDGFWRSMSEDGYRSGGHSDVLCPAVQGHDLVLRAGVQFHTDSRITPPHGFKEACTARAQPKPKEVAAHPKSFDSMVRAWRPRAGGFVPAAIADAIVPGSKAAALSVWTTERPFTPPGGQLRWFEVTAPNEALDLAGLAVRDRLGHQRIIQAPCVAIPKVPLPISLDDKWPISAGFDVPDWVQWCASTGDVLGGEVSVGTLIQVSDQPGSLGELSWQGGELKRPTPGQ